MSRNFQKRKSGDFNESKHMIVSWFQVVESENVRDEWLRPVEVGDIIADSRQRESETGVTTRSLLTAGGGQKATRSTTYSSLMSKAQQNRTAASPSANYFLLLRVSRHFEDQPILFVFPGGRRTQVSPRVLCVSELQGGA